MILVTSQMDFVDDHLTNNALTINIHKILYEDLLINLFDLNFNTYRLRNCFH